MVWVALDTVWLAPSSAAYLRGNPASKLKPRVLRVDEASGR